MPIPQITIPGLSYNVPSMDIGSGYAAGITSAGTSLAGAIKSVMGGVDPKTGEVQEGILSQNQTATDLIEASKNAGLIDQATADGLHGASLGAKQKWWGAVSGTLAQRISEQGALQRQQISEAGATARAQAQLQLEQQKLLLEKQPVIITGNPQNPQNPATPNPAVPKAPVLTPAQARAQLESATRNRAGMPPAF